ncbi:MAG TPA: hypothetical protein VLB76_17765 [Thermoanaerobaculia bacterium]|nr:hypothetical protein [Thermoanaerobaculia bacterium]
MNWPRHTFDTLERGLAPLVARHPRMALPAASGLGALRNRLSHRWPSPEQIQTLFPQLAPRAAARVAWKIGALEARNRLLVEAIRRQGLEPVRRLMRPASEAFAALRPPLILGTFHVGAVQALGAAIERLPGPVLVLRLGALYSPSPPVEIVSTEGDDQRRALAFQRALAHLAGGGFVVLALDGSPGPGLRVPCLGRTLELARGPFALARLTGAPLVPLVARWRNSEVEAEVGAAIVGMEEGALAASAARWLEGYLMAAPEEIGLGLVRALLTPPLAAR